MRHCPLGRTDGVPVTGPSGQTLHSAPRPSGSAAPARAPIILERFINFGIIRIVHGMCKEEHTCELKSLHQKAPWGGKTLNRGVGEPYTIVPPDPERERGIVCCKARRSRIRAHVLACLLPARPLVETLVETTPSFPLVEMVYQCFYGRTHEGRKSTPYLRQCGR